MDASVPSLKNFQGGQVGGRNHETEKYPAIRETDVQYHAVTWADQQHCLKSQQEEKDKQASNPVETDGIDVQDEGDWTLVAVQSRRRSLPLRFP